MPLSPVVRAVSAPVWRRAAGAVAASAPLVLSGCLENVDWSETGSRLLQALQSPFTHAAVAGALWVGVDRLVFARRIARIEQEPADNAARQQFRIGTLKTLQRVWLGAAVCVGLAALGVDIGATIAGLGLATFGIGFALREFVQNFIGFASNALKGTFQIGDDIALPEGPKGIVESISWQHLTVRCADAFGDEMRVKIPFGKLFNESVHAPIRHQELIDAIQLGEWITLGDTTGRVVAKTDLVLLIEQRDANGVAVRKPVALQDLNAAALAHRGHTPPALPFGIGPGDDIAVGEMRGKVIAFDADSVTLLAQGGKLLVIPRSKLCADGVTMFPRAQERRT